jgi:hypothetical protein
VLFLAWNRHFIDTRVWFLRAKSTDSDKEGLTITLVVTVGLSYFPHSLPWGQALGYVRKSNFSVRCQSLSPRLQITTLPSYRLLQKFPASKALLFLFAKYTNQPFCKPLVIFFPKRLSRII